MDWLQALQAMPLVIGIIFSIAAIVDGIAYNLLTILIGITLIFWGIGLL